MNPETPASGLRRRMPLLPSLLTGVITGIVYGVLARIAFGTDSPDFFGVMTAAFLFLVPFGVGFVTVWVGERQGRWSWWRRIFVPWIPAVLCLAGALAVAWEGVICVVLWLPLFVIMSSLGGVTAGAVLWFKSRSKTALLCFLALPFLAAPVEHRLGRPEQHRVVETAIEINADPATVWANIARVPAIRPDELGFTWTHLIGFPRPIAATLSQEGVGGVRHATFEKGVLFVETVTTWEPERRLAFSIAADPESIPAAALDEHVTVGGPFFDVLDGEYQIEELEPGRLRLHLKSTHRLSTRFNAYSGLWTDFILRDVQTAILKVLKLRCEAGKVPAARAS